MKKYCLVLVLFSAIIVSCENKEEKAYVNAKNSTSTFILKNYLAKYGEDAPIEHIDEIQQKLNELTNDSVDYELVLGNNADISQKYNAEKNYLNKHPNGLHFKEVDSMMKADEPAYNEWLVAKKAQEEAEAKKALYEEKYGIYRDRMENFLYKREEKIDDYSVATYFVFDIPDEDGNGFGLRFETFFKLSNLFKYEIQDNGDIYIQIFNLSNNGTRGVCNLSSDCLYINIGGDLNRYQRVLAIDEYPKFIKTIRKNKDK